MHLILICNSISNLIILKDKQEGLPESSWKMELVQELRPMNSFVIIYNFFITFPECHRDPQPLQEILARKVS